MPKTTESFPGVGKHADDTFDALHQVLVLIKLTSYAIDAMRVLNVLQRHADQCGSFDQKIKSICADWRNPGALDDPADLITEALVQASTTMFQILNRIRPDPMP